MDRSKNVIRRRKSIAAALCFMFIALLALFTLSSCHTGYTELALPSQNGTPTPSPSAALPEGSATPDASGTVNTQAPADTTSTPPKDTPAQTGGEPSSENGTITQTGLTSPITRNHTATVSIAGKPDTEYGIEVFYSSSASTAGGLENKTSDSEGSVSWSWKIGGKTKLGTFEIRVTGGGDTFKTYITVE